MKNEKKISNKMTIEVSYLTSIKDIQNIYLPEASKSSYYKIQNISASFILNNLMYNEKITLMISSIEENNPKPVEIISKNPIFSIFSILLLGYKKTIVKQLNNKAMSIRFPTPEASFLYSYINNFYLVAIGKNLYYLSIQDELIYILNTKFIIIKVLIIKKIKKLGLRKKSDVVFFYDEKKQNKQISFLSAFNRLIFSKELLSKNLALVVDTFDSDKLIEEEYISDSEIVFQRQTLLNMLKSKNYYYLHDILKYLNSEILDQCPVSYYRYTGLAKALDIEKGNIKKKNLCFYLFNFDIVNKLFNQCFYDFINLSFDLNSDPLYVKYIEEQIYKFKEEAFIEMQEKKARERLSTSASELMLKNRVRHIADKRKKKIVCGKCNFKNITFFYYLNKSQDEKNKKKMIVSTGSFEVEKDGKVSKYLYFEEKNILYE